MNEYKLGTHGHLTCLRKQPQEKQTGELFATKHALMDCLMMYPQNGGEICVLRWCTYKTLSCKFGHIYTCVIKYTQLLIYGKTDFVTDVSN